MQRVCIARVRKVTDLYILLAVDAFGDCGVLTGTQINVQICGTNEDNCQV